MTLVTIDVSDVASETHLDDKVVFWAPNHRPGTHTANNRQPLAEGKAEVELKPGPVMVQFQCRGISDTEPKLGTVPESGTVTLDDVLDDAWEYSPEVVRAAQRARDEARDAAQDARDTAEGIPAAVTTQVDVQVPAAVDAAISDRIPTDLALRRDTTVGTRIMVGNTMIFGDTGWRDVTNDSSSAIEVLSGGHILVRRIGSRVMWNFSGVRATSSYGPALTGLATGWRPSARQVSMTMGADQSAGAKWEITTYQIAYSSATSGRMLATTNEEVIVEIVTDQAWPRSQPGSPA